MRMKRIQLDMPIAKVKEIEEIMEHFGISTKKDYFNIAINLLNWALKERENGKAIAAVDKKEDSYKEIILPV